MKNKMLKLPRTLAFATFFLTIPFQTWAAGQQNFDDKVCRFYLPLNHTFVGQVFYSPNNTLRIEYQYGKAVTPTLNDSEGAVAELESSNPNATNGYSILHEGAACNKIFSDNKANIAVAAGIREMVMRWSVSSDLPKDTLNSLDKLNFLLAMDWNLDKNHGTPQQMLGPQITDSILRKETSVGTGGAPLEKTTQSGSAVARE